MRRRPAAWAAAATGDRHLELGHVAARTSATTERHRHRRQVQGPERQRQPERRDRPGPGRLDDHAPTPTGAASTPARGSTSTVSGGQLQPDPPARRRTWSARQPVRLAPVTAGRTRCAGGAAAGHRRLQRDRLHQFDHVAARTSATTERHRHRRQVRGPERQRQPGRGDLPGRLDDQRLRRHGNGTLNAAEGAAAPAAMVSTAADGTYTLALNPGSYLICEVVTNNWAQTKPSGTACQNATKGSSFYGPGGYAVTVTSRSSAPDKDFGNVRSRAACRVARAR